MAGRSVRARTVGVALAVVGVALLLGAVVLVGSLDVILTRELRAAATVQAAEAARVVASEADPAAAVAGDGDRVVQVLDAHGGVLAATPNATGRPALALLRPGDTREVAVTFDDERFLVAAAAVGDGRIVLAGRTTDDIHSYTRTLAVLLFSGVPVLLGVVGVTAWRAVGRALGPVDAIRAEADAITGARLDRRVPRPASDDEIGRLADTVNRMLDRLQHSRDRQRRFVADASHELRSPIAVLRQQAEVALGHPGAIPPAELARTTLAESLRMQALVEDLLLLAQADEERLPLRAAPLDFDDLVLDEARRLRTAGVTVEVVVACAAPMTGDAPALRRVLRNLGDNAARHTRSRVGFTLTETDGTVVLNVDDDGPGIPPAERERVFDRFVRLDDARDRSGGGTGLGLAIVTEVITAHSGRVTITDSPWDGARFTVRLRSGPGGFGGADDRAV